MISRDFVPKPSSGSFAVSLVVIADVTLTQGNNNVLLDSFIQVSDSAVAASQLSVLALASVGIGFVSDMVRTTVRVDTTRVTLLPLTAPRDQFGTPVHGLVAIVGSADCQTTSEISLRLHIVHSTAFNGTPLLAADSTSLRSGHCRLSVAAINVTTTSHCHSIPQSTAIVLPTAQFRQAD